VIGYVVLGPSCSDITSCPVHIRTTPLMRETKERAACEWDVKENPKTPIRVSPTLPTYLGIIRPAHVILMKPHFAAGLARSLVRWRWRGRRRRRRQWLRHESYTPHTLYKHAILWVIHSAWVSSPPLPHHHHLHHTHLGA